MRRFYLLLFFCFLSSGVFAQSDTVLSDSSALADSITASTVEATPSVPSKTDLMPGKKMLSNNKSGAFLLFLIIFLLLGLLRFLHPKYIENLFNTLTQGTTLKQSSVDQLVSNNAPKIIFSVVYFLSTGFILSKLSIYLNKEEICDYNPKFIGLSILFVLVAYAYKYLIVSLLAWVFEFKNFIKGFFQYINFTNQIVGLVLLPICAFLLLCMSSGNHFMLIIGLVVFFISLIIKYIAGFAYIKQIPKVNIFHFILYLCALEIIPMSILGKWLLNNV